MTRIALKVTSQVETKSDLQSAISAQPRTPKEAPQAVHP